MVGGVGLGTNPYSIARQQSKYNPLTIQSLAPTVVQNPSALSGTTVTPGSDAVKSALNVQSNECATCASRKYQDGSDDPGVSMKTPTHLSPEQASSAVISHEMEHVFREQSAAQRENREVVSQSVQIHNTICPECGRMYVSGGKTTTTTRAKPENPPSDAGNSIDFYA